MTQGRILLGEHKGVYLLKFVGDVRVNLCVTMDTCLREVLDQKNFCSALVDLSETDGIDSTALGLLARLSLETKRRYGAVPTLVSTRGDITRILETMGFDDIFNLVDQPLECPSQLGERPLMECCEEDARQRVLDAHRTLRQGGGISEAPVESGARPQPERAAFPRRTITYRNHQFRRPGAMRLPALAV